MKLRINRQNDTTMVRFVCSFLIVCVAALPARSHAQAQPQTPEQVQAPEQRPPSSAQTAESAPARASSETDDRFHELRVYADQLMAAYQVLDDKNTPEVQRLVQSSRCQIARVGGLLDRTIAGLQKWREAELKYWDSWGEAEQKRVEGEQNTLATYEREQQRLADFIGNEKQDIDKLQQSLEELEKTPTKTQVIREQIEAKILDVKATQADLDKTQGEYEDLTTQISVMKGLISKRLVEIRQNRIGVEAFVSKVNASYEKLRASAQDVCQTKGPKNSQPGKQ
jgi:chromosome segregation ATPase